MQYKVFGRRKGCLRGKITINIWWLFMTKTCQQQKNHQQNSVHHTKLSRKLSFTCLLLKKWIISKIQSITPNFLGNYHLQVCFRKNGSPCRGEMGNDEILHKTGQWHIRVIKETLKNTQYISVTGKHCVLVRPSEWQIFILWRRLHHISWYISWKEEGDIL